MTIYQLVYLGTLKDLKGENCFVEPCLVRSKICFKQQHGCQVSETANKFLSSKHKFVNGTNILWFTSKTFDVEWNFVCCFNVWLSETKLLKFQRNVEEEFDLFQKIFTIMDNGFLQFKKGFNVLLHARRGDRLKFVFDQGFLVGNFGRWRQGHWCGRIEKLRHVESVLHLLAEHAFGFLDVWQFGPDTIHRERNQFDVAGSAGVGHGQEKAAVIVTTESNSCKLILKVN